MCLGCWARTGAPPVGLATPPKLLSESEIQKIAGDATDWNARKSWCDDHLNQPIGSGYVGFDWHDAVISYSTCHRVAKYLDPSAGSVQAYADKTLALMRVMARDQVYGTPFSSQEFLAVGNGTTRTFTLRMPPAAGSTVKVYLAPLTQKSFAYSGATTTLCPDYCFDAIVSEGDSADGPAAYGRSVDDHEGYPNQLHWLTGNHPANGATFYARVADQDFTTVSAGNVSVSGAMLTLTTAPAMDQAVFVEYLGPSYATATVSNVAAPLDTTPPAPPQMLRVR